MENAVLVQDIEGFLYIADSETIKKTLPKVFKMYCYHCGAIIVTSNPDEYTYCRDDEDENYYMCRNCSDDRSVEYERISYL